MVNASKYEIKIVSHTNEADVLEQLTNGLMMDDRPAFTKAQLIRHAAMLSNFKRKMKVDNLGGFQFKTHAKYAVEKLQEIAERGVGFNMAKGKKAYFITFEIVEVS